MNNVIEQQKSNSLNISFEKRFGPEFFKRIPKRSGVFWMLDRRRRLLLVGKSQDLNTKLSSFRELLPEFCSKHEMDLVKEVHDISWTECENIAAAELIEKELIHRRQPAYQFAPLDLKHFFYFEINLKKSQIVAKILPYQKKTPLSYGAFKSPQLGRQVLSALMRHLWVHWRGGGATNWPLQLVKYPFPNHYHLHQVRLSEVESWNWQQNFEDFFLGNSSRICNRFSDLLNEKADQLDTFTENWLKKDLETLYKFYHSQCTKLHQLRIKRSMNEKQISPDCVETFKISPRNTIS